MMQLFGAVLAIKGSLRYVSLFNLLFSWVSHQSKALSRRLSEQTSESHDTTVPSRSFERWRPLRLSTVAAVDGSGELMSRQHDGPPCFSDQHPLSSLIQDSHKTV